MIHWLLVCLLVSPTYAKAKLQASSTPRVPTRRILDAHENLRQMSLALGRDDCSVDCFKKAKGAVRTLQKYQVITTKEAAEHDKLILKQEKEYHTRKGIQQKELMHIQDAKETKALQIETQGHLSGQTKHLDHSIRLMLLDGAKARQLSDGVFEKLIQDTDLPSTFVKQSLDRLEKIPYLKIDKDSAAKLSILSTQVSLQNLNEAQLMGAEKKLIQIKENACERLAFKTCQIAEESLKRIQSKRQALSDEQLLQWLHPQQHTLLSNSGAHILFPHTFQGLQPTLFGRSPLALQNPWQTLSPFWAAPWGF
jgi:hypothetical protein